MDRLWSFDNVHRAIPRILGDQGRSEKPRNGGITIILDRGSGPAAVADLIATAAGHVDYAKIAWGSALITANLEDKLEQYRAGGIAPMLGGSLFEIAYLRGQVEELLALARDLAVHVEISDGVIELSRRDKLHWIEQFAKVVEVFSEAGGKTSTHDHDWIEVIKEERSAGAGKVVIEGREIGPVGKPIREDLIDLLVEGTDLDSLVFEALERPQQVFLIKRLGANVNLGNIRPEDLLTLESFRRGLKEHTLLHFSPGGAGSAASGATD